MTPPSQLLRREFWRGLALAVPLAALLPMMLVWVGPFSHNPWGVAALLVPLALGVALLGWPLLRDRRLILGGGLLPFFFGYCLLFTLGAGTDLLNGRRQPLAGHEDSIPSNFIGLSRLGDWHYWVAPKSPPARDLLIVTRPSLAGRDLDEVRTGHAALIKAAIERGARGIAFDYRLAQESRSDGVLCYWIGKAEDAGMPVILTTTFEADASGALLPVELTPALEACVAPKRRGHAGGYLESDGQIRMVHLFMEGNKRFPSISYRIAAILGGKNWEPPPRPFVQFTLPSEPPLIINETPEGEATRNFAGRFVLVGSFRQSDVYETPFGQLPGVTIHALAAHSLRSGHFIRRLGSFWTFPSIFVFCYLLTAVQAAGGGRRRLLHGAGLLSVFIVVTAALAMRFGLVWVDVSYPLVAIWLLTALLAGGAAFQKARLSALPASARPAAADKDTSRDAEPFDVFLSHNSRDKTQVVELGEALKRRGLRVWLDVWELVPGRPWQEALEEVVETARSAAILLGRDGLGPWEVPEMRACLDECVNRGLPVIPVLLPGTGETPELPLFLRRFTWVDLRGGLAEVGLDSMEWGITGIKPRRKRA